MADQIAKAVSEITLRDTDDRFAHVATQFSFNHAPKKFKSAPPMAWANRDHRMIESKWQEYRFVTIDMRVDALQYVLENNVFTHEYLLYALQHEDTKRFWSSEDLSNIFLRRGWTKTRHKIPHFRMFVGFLAQTVSATGESIRRGHDEVRWEKLVHSELIQTLTNYRNGPIHKFWSAPKVEPQMVIIFRTGEMVEEAVDTPYNCSVASETYWST